MTVITRPTSTDSPETPTRPRGAHWIDHWEPDDEEFWEQTGARIARRNLGWSMFSEHLGFSVWVIWMI